MITQNRLLSLSVSTLLSLCTAVSMVAQSPYISRVWDFLPAPGQFVNQLPEYEPGDDSEAMRRKAEEAIAHNNRGMISLGGWGGYVVFGFDHMIPNIAGQNDFIVLGNAFYSTTGAQQDGRPGGSCEPGVVMVSYDANGNGQPDDEWYELAGSEYTNPQTIHNYTRTYYRSSPDTYPEWIDADSLTFTGTRLPDNYEDLSGEGTYYVQYAYPWGYVDNHPNNSEQARLNIEWAVNNNGEPANLPGIHFVKVYTGVSQHCGWLGETSTEVTGATDLHLQTSLSPTTLSTTPTKQISGGTLILHLPDGRQYTIIGTKL